MKKWGHGSQSLRRRGWRLFREKGFSGVTKHYLTASFIWLACLPLGQSTANTQTRKYKHTQTCSNTHTLALTLTNPDTCTYTLTHRQTHAHTHTYKHMHTHIHTCKHMHTHTHTCKHMHTHLQTQTHAHTHSHKDTHKKANTQRRLSENQTLSKTLLWNLWAPRYFN